MENPLIGIVIPIIQKKYILKLLSNIKNIINNGNCIVCVVNDGNTRINNYLNQNLPKNIELLTLEKNLGFSSANNNGWQYLIDKYPSIIYLGTINDDTVPDENWLRQMEMTLKKNPNVGACSPGMITYTGFLKNKKKYYSTYKLSNKKIPVKI